MSLTLLQLQQNMTPATLQVLINTIIHAIFTKYKITFDEFSTITIGDDIDASVREYCERLVPPPVTTKKVFRKKATSVAEMLNSPTAVIESTPIEVMQSTPIEVMQSTPAEVIDSTPAEVIPILNDPKPIVGSPIASMISASIEPAKPKKVIKKKVVETIPVEVAPISQAQVAEVIHVEVVMTSPAQVAETTPVEVAETTQASVSVAETKPKKVIKKKVAETIPVQVANTSPLVVEESTPAAMTVEAVKPKKVIKKKAAADILETVPVPVEAAKPKKVIKKKTEVNIAESTKLIETVEEPPAIELPKEKIIELTSGSTITLPKIIKKKPTVELVPEPKPLPVSSIKTIPITEYAEDGEQSSDIYDGIEIDEEVTLEPREIDGVSYYVDPSGYVYHFENKDLIGKINEKSGQIIFLRDFNSS